MRKLFHTVLLSLKLLISHNTEIRCGSCYSIEGVIRLKSKEELELENKILKELLKKQAKQSSKNTIAPKKMKKVMYQCRYCGYKSIRNATDGAPTITANCPKHPKGWCKGVHSWQRTFL